MTEPEEARRRDDPEFVARQLRDAAEHVENRRCLWCAKKPPGLMFQPSEQGVTEMGFWTCGCEESWRAVLLERYGPCQVCEGPFTEEHWHERHTPRDGGDAHSVAVTGRTAVESLGGR